MKISYKRGFANDYVYKQVIRCENEKELKQIQDIIKDNVFTKQHTTHIEIWLDSVQNIYKFFLNKRIKYTNTIILFKNNLWKI